MKIIAHRGLWESLEEKNTEIAFKNALSNGFGIETDFRDYRGELVISHDIPTGKELCADDFFNLYSNYKQQPMLALNIKADGLQSKLKKLIEKYNINNYFVFDMSIPDTIEYINEGFNIATRHSEYEQEFPFYKNSSFVWIDSFISDWFSEIEIKKHLDNQKKVCIVSSDLHKREYKKTWEKYKQIKNDNWMICTDYPMKAKEFFND